MKITLKMIHDRLSKFNPEPGITLDEIKIINKTNFMGKNLQESFEPDVLYFGRTSDFPKHFPKASSVNIVCVADRYFPQKYRNNPAFNFILFNKGTDIGALFNEIQDLFAEHTKIHGFKEKLTESLISAGGMKDIVNTAFELLGNPITIVDVGHRYIASTEIELEDKYWNDAFKREYVASEVVLMLKKSDEIREIFRSRTPVIFNTHVNTKEILANVFINQKIVARISVHELCREFKEADMEIISYLSQIVALEMQKGKYYYINRSQPFESFLNDLLEDKISNQAEVNDRIKYIEFPLKKYHYVFSIDISQKEYDLNMQTEIMEQISLIVHNSITVIYNSAIVTLISLDSIEDASEASLKDLEAYVRNNGLVGGLSSGFNYIGDFKKYYTRSTAALRLSSHTNSKKVIHRYENHFFHHIAEICSKSTNLTSLYHPCVFFLLENDKRNSGDLLKSLFFYLKHDKSITETANALHIHRNTLDYRISKIKSVIHIDWDNSDVLKHIYVSLRMLEYMEHISFDS